MRIFRAFSIVPIPTTARTRAIEAALNKNPLFGSLITHWAHVLSIAEAGPR
jgi:hypothetical protein